MEPEHAPEANSGEPFEERRKAENKRVLVIERAIDSLFSQVSELAVSTKRLQDHTEGLQSQLVNLRGEFQQAQREVMTDPEVIKLWVTNIGQAVQDNAKRKVLDAIWATMMKGWRALTGLGVTVVFIVLLLAAIGKWQLIMMIAESLKSDLPTATSVPKQ